MTTFYIGDDNRQTERNILQYEGDVKNHSLDMNVWADDNAAVTSVTWSVESGTGSISNSTLASNVETFDLTTSTTGTGMLKALITDGTNTKAVYIKYQCRDPQAIESIPDYGLTTC